MKLAKSQLEKIIQEELAEILAWEPPMHKSRSTTSPTLDSPIRKVEYSLEEVENLVAALPALEKAGLLSLHLSSLKREMSEWVATNIPHGRRRQELLDLIRPNPILSKSNE